jgi:hypothetical protein
MYDIIMLMSIEVPDNQIAPEDASHAPLGHLHEYANQDLQQFENDGYDYTPPPVQEFGRVAITEPKPMSVEERDKHRRRITAIIRGSKPANILLHRHPHASKVEAFRRISRE